MVDEAGRSTETRLVALFARYDPKTARLGRAVRARLRERLPGLLELVYVYERQEALVLSYSPSETGSAGVCALALYPRRVHLCLSGGDRLSKSDPNGLLQGRGKSVRHVVLGSLADFESADVERLLAAAVKLARVRLDPSATGAVILKADAQKQRARRAKTTTRPVPRRRPAQAGA
jgi:hypothetical protein